jgi:uncharacterized protein (UPF0333 family)
MRRVGGSSGQVAMEYLLITGFVFLILAVIMVISYSQSAAFSRQVTASQIQKVGNQIIDAANGAYYAGPPTKRTLTLYFPELINNVSIDNTSLTFTVQGEGGVYEYSISAATNMTGTIRNFAGIHTISIEAQDNIVNITDG